MIYIYIYYCVPDWVEKGVMLHDVKVAWDMITVFRICILFNIY